MPLEDAIKVRAIEEVRCNDVAVGGKSVCLQAQELEECMPLEDAVKTRAIEEVRCNDIMRWILEDDVDNSISQLGRLFGNTKEDSKAFEITTSSEIEEFNKKANMLMNELVAVGTFDDKDLDLHLVQEDIALLNEIGLENMVHRKTSVLRKSNVEKKN